MFDPVHNSNPLKIMDAGKLGRALSREKKRGASSSAEFKRGGGGAVGFNETKQGKLGESPTWVNNIGGRAREPGATTMSGARICPM